MNLGTLTIERERRDMDDGMMSDSKENDFNIKGFGEALGKGDELHVFVNVSLLSSAPYKSNIRRSVSCPANVRFCSKLLPRTTDTRFILFPLSFHL